SVETLAAAGVASINLVPDSSTTALTDGSSIDGVSTFTRADETTGTAATVSFSVDTNGYAVTQTITHNADGSTSVDNRALNPDGSLAGDSTTTTSADGRSKTTSFDQNGDGIVDQVQTDATVVNPNGSRTETLTDATGAGVLNDQTVTTTSADGKTI